MNSNYKNSAELNSASHPCAVSKSSIARPGYGYRRVCL